MNSCLSSTGERKKETEQQRKNLSSLQGQARVKGVFFISCDVKIRGN